MITLAQVILAASMLFGAGYLRIADAPRGHLRAVQKTLPVLLLALYALVTVGPGFLVAALALGALGDALLAYDGERAFLAGLCAFLLSHVAYGLLFFAVGDIGFILDSTWRLGAAFLAIAAAGALLLHLWKPAGKLAPAVAAYSIAIVAMTVLSLGAGPVLAFVGAVLFMASDSALSLQVFAIQPQSAFRAPLSYVVWATYYLAQLTLAVTMTGTVVF